MKTSLLIPFVWCVMSLSKEANAQISLLNDTNVLHQETDKRVEKDSFTAGNTTIKSKVSTEYTSKFELTNIATLLVDSGKIIFYQTHIEKEDGTGEKILLQNDWQSFNSKGKGKDVIKSTFNIIKLGAGADYRVHYTIREEKGNTIDREKLASEWIFSITKDLESKFEISSNSSKSSAKKHSRSFNREKRLSFYKHRGIGLFTKKDTVREYKKAKPQRKKKRVSRECRF